jgi:hypothetical protein
MKRNILLLVILITAHALIFAQTYDDDVYIRPSVAKNTKIEKKTAGNQVNTQKPNYKNGAKEIIFIDRNIETASDSSELSGDTLQLVQMNDSIENDSLENQESGYYLNGFKGTESDLEYAERIRKFHNPKFTITIGDPGYNDIYFLDNYDWNVYIDGNYAWVTPTWTNPYWFDYNYMPYSYNSWYWRTWNSPYYGWGYSPWSWGYGWNSYYGWGGYMDYYGWGYPYYGYNNWGYYGWGGGYYSGYTSKNKNYDEGTRRSHFNNTGNANSTMTTNAGGYSGSRNQYTTLSGTRSAATTTRNGGTTTMNASSNTTSRSDYNRNTASGTDRNVRVVNPSRPTGTATSRSNYVSTQSRTGFDINRNNRSSYSTNDRTTYSPNNRSTYSNQTGTTTSVPSGGSRTTYTPANTTTRTTFSTGSSTRSSSSPQGRSYDSGSSRSTGSSYQSSRTYSTPSSSSSSSSYSSGSSSSSSSSSSGGGGSRSGGGGGGSSSGGRR